MCIVRVVTKSTIITNTHAHVLLFIEKQKKILFEIRRNMACKIHSLFCCGDKTLHELRQKQKN